MALVPLSVLYVDDEPEFIDLGKAYLSKDALINVIGAASAAEAIQLISERSFDAIVSDYQMPEMNGIEFLRFLRRSGNDTPFIIFTGKGREEVVIQALNGGADFYLQKGGDPGPMYAELEGKIRHAVEKRGSDAALRASENRLRRAEEVAGFGHWEIHLEEGTIIGSKGAMVLYGLEKPVWPLKLVQQIPLPEYREALDTALRDLVREGKRYDLVFKIPRVNDGRILDVHSIAEYDASKKIVFGVIEDVSEQQKALEAAYEAKEQLKLAMDLAKLVRWEYDVADDVFTFDDQFYSLFATNAEREGGERMSSEEYTERFLPPEERTLVGREIASMMGSTYPDYSSQIEHDIVRRDGVRRTIVVRIKGIRDSSGRIVKSFGANQDITERKQMERALRESETKYHSIIDNASDLIFLHPLGTEGDFPSFMDVNLRACQVLGFSREEMLKLSPKDIITGESQESEPDRLARIRREAKATFEVEVKRKDDGTIPMEMNVAVFDLAGTKMVMAIGRDISERKLAESRLHRANTKLELLGSITRHDINNQMTVLRGNLSMLKVGVTDEKALARFSRMESAAEEIEKRFQFVKDYQSSGTESPEWHDLVQLIERLPIRRSVEFLDIGERAKGLEILADPMLKIVFHNLLEDSVKYASKPVRVLIDCVPGSNGLSIIYEDIGPGIPADKKESIFVKGGTRASAMGLFLCKQILADSAIDIREVGQPGRGVRFEMLVPEGRFRVHE